MDDIDSDDGHLFDDDGVCERCGFDGAEWVWWKRSTYEGRASDVEMPSCKNENKQLGLTGVVR